eukprot:Pgem_evm1s12279
MENYTQIVYNVAEGAYKILGWFSKNLNYKHGVCIVIFVDEQLWNTYCDRILVTNNNKTSIMQFQKIELEELALVSENRE